MLSGGESGSHCRRGRPSDQEAVFAGGFHQPQRVARGGLLRAGSSTNSIACIRPMPRTSPMSGYFSFSSSSCARKIGAGLGGVGQQVFLFDEIDHGFGGGGGNGIAAKRGDGQRLSRRRRSPGAATVRPMGKPLPRPLALVMISGVTPHCSMPNHFPPVRPQPVWTSSLMKTPPYF